MTRRMAMAEFGRAQMYQLARAKAHVFSPGPGRGPLQAHLTETGRAAARNCQATVPGRRDSPARDLMGGNPVGPRNPSRSFNSHPAY